MALGCFLFCVDVYFAAADGAFQFRGLKLKSAVNQLNSYEPEINTRAQKGPFPTTLRRAFNFFCLRPEYLALFWPLQSY
jgi:hypothetical protein